MYFQFFFLLLQIILTIGLVHIENSKYSSLFQHITLRKKTIMTIKNLKLWIFLLCASTILGMNAQSILIFEKNGSKTDFTLSNLRSITFSSSDLILKNRDGSTPIPFSIAGLRFLSFTQSTEISTPSGEEKTISIYPNPVRDILNIHYTYALNENISIEILSADGKIIYNKPFNLSNTLHSINTGTWSRGIYLVRFKNGTEVITKKIIKN